MERSPESKGTSRDGVQGLSEESLVEAAKRGHSLAFDALSERYRKQLFRAANRITRSREDAEDAVQDTLLRAFVHVTDFDGRSSFGTWLTRIAINSALMILRKKRSLLEIATDSEDKFGADGARCEITEHQPNPERRYAQNEEENMLREAIQSLRPGLRVAVQIQLLQERSMKETAEAIGISITAVKGRMFHARKALRRLMIRKLARQPRFGSEMRVLSTAQCLMGQTAGLKRKSTLKAKNRGEEWRRLSAATEAESPRDPWRRANARTGFANQRLFNHKEEGDEDVIKSKKERKYRAPSKFQPGDGQPRDEQPGDGGVFSGGLGA